MKTKELELLINEGKGALPIQAINTMKREGFIKNSTIQPGPSSLDLALSDECYEVKKVIMPRYEQEVFSLIKNEMGGKKHTSNVLFPGKQYLIANVEKFRLPAPLYGYANPKSTTGRCFVHARLFSDGVDQFDHINDGFNGKIWTLVIPQLFPISYRPGIDTLNQMRIFIKDARLSELEMRGMQAKYCSLKYENGVPFYPNTGMIGGGEHAYMIFSLDCNGVGGIAGYKAKSSKKVLPIGGIDCSNWKDYFEPIYSAKYLDLDPLGFYILSTTERISIPPEYAAELKPIDVRYGEIRAHYAGFIDNGFGYEPANPFAGNTVTLEVRAFEKTSLWHRQPIACMQFEHMSTIPETLYGKTSGTYSVQIGARLPKQFKI